MMKIMKVKNLIWIKCRNR